jgi:hypothetical protein
MYELDANQAFYSSVEAIDYGATGQYGADVTADNTAYDTVYVNGVPSSSISPIAGLMPIETGADKTKNHVLTTSVSETIGVQMSSGSPIAYTFLQFAVIANDSSDVFSINAVIEWEPNGGYFLITQPCVLGYVDTPAVIGTSPNYGGVQPSTTTYKTFGFGVGAFSAHSYVYAGGADAGPLGTATFCGSVTGLSAGSHTLSLLFISNSQSGGSYLTYAHAELTQISS